MQIVAKKRLRQFWEKQPQAKTAVKAWYAVVAKVIWKKPADIKATFGTAVDFIADNRVVFDISGNKYRLVAHISYEYKAVLIKFIGTHAEYDKINARTVS